MSFKVLGEHFHVIYVGITQYRITILTRAYILEKLGSEAYISTCRC